MKKMSSFRGASAVLSQGVASASAFLLSIAVAQSGGLYELGVFAIAHACFQLISLAARDTTITPLLTQKPTPESFRIYAQRQSFIGAITAPIVFLIGILASSEMLMILGACLHGMLMLVYSRVVNISIGTGTIAIVQEVIVIFAVVIATVGALFWHWSASTVYLAWAASSAAVGYITALIQKYDLRPLWKASRRESIVGASFGLQSALGAGSIQILTMLTGAFAGTGTVGTLRGGATVVAPAGTIVTSIHPLLLRRQANRFDVSHKARIRQIARDSLALTGAYLVIALSVVTVFFFWGEWILGDVWLYVRVIIWVVIIDGVVAVLGQIPALFHRATWEHRRSLFISALVLLVRFPLVIMLAINQGAIGAAVGNLIAGTLSVSLFWISALEISRRNSLEDNNPSFD